MIEDSERSGLKGTSERGRERVERRKEQEVRKKRWRVGGVGGGGVTSINSPNCEALMMIKLSYC